MQTFQVSGMTCGHCVKAVTQAVKAIDKGSSVAVDLDAGRVTVTGETVPVERIAAAISAEGYAVEKLAA